MSRSYERYAVICAGAAVVALSLELFYIPHRLMDGGITGLAVLIARQTGVSPVYLLSALNLACLLAGVRTLPVAVIKGTAAGVTSMAVVLSLVGPLPPVCAPEVAAVAGGVGLGFGLGVVLRAGGTLDGAEIVGLCLQRWQGFPLVWFLFSYNAALFAAAAALHGARMGMNSVVAQAVALVVVGALLWPRAPQP